MIVKLDITYENNDLFIRNLIFTDSIKRLILSLLNLKLLFMKKLFPFAIMLVLSISLINAQTTKTKKDPAGDWKFEAPYAPEGYNNGKITIGFAEKKNTIVISMTGSDYKINGENVKFLNDSLTFLVYLEGETVGVRMKMEDAVKMTGVATSSQGDIPLTATKQVK